MKTKIFFTLFLALGAVAAKAATVHLKGGGALVGRVIRSDARQTVLETSQGRVSIDASRIERIDDSTPPAAAPARAAPPATYAPERRQEELFGRRAHSLSLDLGLAAPLSSIDFGSIQGGRANNGDLGARIGL
jgi:hypothetical protein